MMRPLLDVQNLTIELTTRDGVAPVIDDLSFSLNAGETLSFVGESGCGKSMTALALMVGSAILFEAGLSFLGLTDPNVVSWGQIIGSNRQYILDAGYTVTIPGVAIFVTVLAISLVGDGLNDALNPKLRQR